MAGCQDCSVSEYHLRFAHGAPNEKLTMCGKIVDQIWYFFVQYSVFKIEKITGKYIDLGLKHRCEMGFSQWLSFEVYSCTA